MRVARARSLVARLTLVQVTVLAALWIVVIGLTIFSAYNRGEGDIYISLRSTAANLATLIVDESDVPRAIRLGDKMARGNEESGDGTSNDPVAYQIWSQDGRLLAHSHEQPTLPELGPAVSLSSSRSMPIDWFVQSVWNADHRIYVVVGKRTAAYHRHVWSDVKGLALMWLVLAVISSVVFWISFKVIIRPVSTLAFSISERSATDLSPVEYSNGFLEIIPLIDALNQKLMRIRTMLDTERQFFLDAAHELRTPLSVIAAQAHVVAHEAEKPDRLMALTTLEAGIERAASVVTRLLTLGKLESVNELSKRACHNINVTAADIVESFQARATASNQNLQLITDQPVMVSCDVESIGVMIENLVDNALRYCPAGSTIEVMVTASPTAATIVVSDNGPGIAPPDRKRAFTRFQRIGTPDSPGSGLGLAIVLRIAELHGGRATILDNAIHRGTIVEVTLPVNS